MGTITNCACANLVHKMISDNIGEVDIDKLHTIRNNENDYDNHKIIKIQSKFRSYLSSK